jgi:RNA polymerase sigma factor (sigma-70 family)
MHDKTPHADQLYITAIRENNNAVIRTIYKKFSPRVISYVRNNSGSVDEAQDIVQETLITLHQQAHRNNLVLTCPFEAYFFLLAKRRWLNKLKQKKGVTITDEALSIHDDTTQAVLETESWEIKNKLFETKFQELGEKCRELLTLSFRLSDMDKVAQALKVTYAYARKKKSLCLGQLTESIHQSAEYKALKK